LRFSANLRFSSNSAFGTCTSLRANASNVAYSSDSSAANTLRPAPPPRIASVQALGLSDALRVELQPSQRAGLVDELRRQQRPTAVAFESARDRWEALSSRKAGDALGQAAVAEAQLDSKAYALRVLAAIGSQVPVGASDEPFAIVGPATTVSSIIEGAARDAADRLGEFLRSPSRPNAETWGKLRELDVAAHAWVETYIACQAVEWYSFDSDCDHVPLPGGC
jgi:hypothetical protein